MPPSSRLLEVAPENIVQYAHYGYVYCMLLITLPSGSEVGGAGGEMLLSGGGDGVVKLWALDPVTSAIKDVKTLGAGDSGVLSMAINDTMLYCGLTDGEICIWDLDTMQLIRSLKTHCEDVLTMSVMGNCIFSGSASGYSRVLPHFIYSRYALTITLIEMESTFRTYESLAVSLWIDLGFGCD